MDLDKLENDAERVGNQIASVTQHLYESLTKRGFEPWQVHEYVRSALHGVVGDIIVSEPELVAEPESPIPSAPSPIQRLSDKFKQPTPADRK